jgi:aminoglycoside phosphotransferase
LLHKAIFGLFLMTNILEEIGSLPLDLEPLVKEYSPQPVTIGQSVASVYLLQAPGKPNLYLKTAPKGSVVTFGAEVERLRWMKGRLPVPEVLYYAETAAGAYLLLTEIMGKMACDPVFEGETLGVVKGLAAGLKMLHSLDITDCPLDARLVVQFEMARQRLEARMVGESDFDHDRQGQTAADLYKELLAKRPASEDLVFIHGDYCLPNILLDPTNHALTGFIDLGRAGVGDRYHDLALAVRSLIYNWGEEYVPVLFEEYGLKKDEIDRSKIEFYKLLDEFF